jgi:prephenate dehydrogenase
MGLIGGSYCKALSARTRHQVWGMNRSKKVIADALACGAIEKEATLEDLAKSDLVIVGYHPELTIRFLNENAAYLPKNGVVMDTCGVKKSIIEGTKEALAAQGVTFVGVHPMAGREFSGFDYATEDLYDGASLIITKTEDTKPDAIALIERISYEIGFGRVVITDAVTHDATIAFTSQIAHVLSNAYVKSPTLYSESGFSAGSFKDLSRVAMLNADMWTELFFMNRIPLLFEVQSLIYHLQQYCDALESSDREKMHRLLSDGTDRKKWSLAHAAQVDAQASQTREAYLAAHAAELEAEMK